MRILHVIPSTSITWGGPVTTMNNLVNIWNISSISSDVLTIAGTQKQVNLNTTSFALPASFPARFANSHMAVQWVRKNSQSYDLVIIHAIWSIVNLRVAAELRRLGIKYLVIPHGSLDPFDLRKKHFLKKLLGPHLVRPFLNGSSAILCSTTLEAKRLVTFGSSTARKVLPWPVNPEVVLINRAVARSSCGFTADQFVVLFLGRIDYKKGFPVLLPAFKRLIQAGLKVRLIIVGPDSNDYGRKVRSMIEKLGIGPQVEIRLPVTGAAKSELFQIADCFVLPSLNENFGNAVVEAMQHRLPVVISNNVYICDSVASARAGFVCSYDASQVFESLRTLATDLPLRAQMAVNAEALGQQFAPEHLVSAYNSLIADLVKV